MQTHCWRVILVIAFCAVGTYSSCSGVGPCEICPPSEAERTECIPTQRRQSYFCDTVGGEDEEIFQSCLRTTEEEMIRVIVFQLIVAIVGAASYGLYKIGRENLCRYLSQEKTNPT